MSNVSQKSKGTETECGRYRFSGYFMCVPLSPSARQKRRLICLALFLGILMSLIEARAVRAASSDRDNQAVSCRLLIEIVRDSLGAELGSPCLKASSSQCEAKDLTLRAILAYIDAQRQLAVDPCDTALEVLERLRALPPDNR